MSLAAILTPACFGPSLAYPAKAKETKVEVIPDPEWEVVEEPNWDQVYAMSAKTPWLPDLRKAPKKLPRGVHPAGKFRRPKV